MMPQTFCHYAITERNTRGRVHPEPPHPYRTDFERDRDRIIHCSAFRRLEGKTQVFTPGLDDYYRTRYTHSIEVAQIGRTIARVLGLNENLTEAICLAHDLGHSPFGHVGEQTLNELMADFGGFEHNRQALWIVDLLEHPYPDFMGLNLLYETRLGLAKHESPYDRPADQTFSESNSSLEGQIAAVADRIAYNCHDLEDGMRAGLLSAKQLEDVAIFAEAWQHIGAPSIDDSTIRRTRTAKTIINKLVGDCIDTSRHILSETTAGSVLEIMAAKESLVRLSADSDAQLAQLEQFLLRHFYLHDALIASADQARHWLRELFETLCQKPEWMPRYFQRFIAEHGLQRAVCNYIAGMTDRFCLKLLEQIHSQKTQ